MKISIIQPSRNNLKYLKWSYDSIRKNQGDHIVEICVADDASTDGTWDWCQEQMSEDKHFKAIRNETGKRLGHTILYDRLVNTVASHDICMIYHADMYLCPGALDAIEDEMYITVDNSDNGVRLKKEKTIVSLTRIEPPLHPDGPEKILKDFGTEPEEFNEQELLDFINSRVPTNNTTEGIFAPWAFWKSDFQEIGGHDPLYAPQSKEDSDIFNRFHLNGIKFVQTWHGCVYHMTCRGSRRNTIDGAPNIQTNNPEWEAQNIRSSRNFIRKWGHFVKHDQFMKPVVPPKYNIQFRLFNCTLQALAQLEPWCSTVYCDLPESARQQYIAQEQENTKIDLSKRVYGLMAELASDDNILVRIDCNKFDWQRDFYYIQNMSEIINDSGSEGTFNLGNLTITIEDMTTYESDLIVCESNIYSK